MTPAGRPGRLRGHREGGSVSLEIAVLVPAVLVAVFGLVQGALVIHARHIALAAASEGLAADVVRGAVDGAGRRAATGFVAAAGGDDVLRQVRVEVDRSPDTASVTVTGRALSLLPGVSGWTVHQTASGPVERFTSGTGR